MSYTEMAVAPALEVGLSQAFEYSEALAAAGDSKFILIPNSVKKIAVTLQGSGGANATLYFSTDTVAIIKSGSGITWVASATLSGETTAVCEELSIIPTAIKMTQANAGASKITVRAQ